MQRALAAGDADAARRAAGPDSSVSVGAGGVARDGSGVVATAAVTDATSVVGHVAVRVDLRRVLDRAARRSGVSFAAVRGRRVVAGTGAGSTLAVDDGRPVDLTIGGTSYRARSETFGREGGRNLSVVALEPRTAIASRASSRRTLVFGAALAAFAALGLAVSAAPAVRVIPRRIARRRSQRMNAREALGLVGDALAATHEPRVLLTIILTTAIEATGAVGGALVDDGVEVARAGDVGGADALDLELEAGGTRGLLRLFPEPRGFTTADVTLARSLASQASIALENAHLHQIVERQATTDDLTQLANRRAFMRALTAEIRRSERSNEPFALVIADIDDFKRVNDRYGHATGDRVLAGFARAIERELRDIDVAARFGGEEFALLVVETDLRGGEAVAERIRRALAATRFVRDDGGSVSVTASFGVAAYSTGASAETLLVASDRALYAAKGAGKNAVVSAASGVVTRRRPARP